MGGIADSTGFFSLSSITRICREEHYFLRPYSYSETSKMTLELVSSSL